MYIYTYTFIRIYTHIHTYLNICAKYMCIPHMGEPLSVVYICAYHRKRHIYFYHIWESLFLWLYVHTTERESLFLWYHIWESLFLSVDSYLNICAKIYVPLSVVCTYIFAHIFRYVCIYIPTLFPSLPLLRVLFPSLPLSLSFAFSFPLQNEPFL